jgi:hypothetical protein
MASQWIPQVGDLAIDLRVGTFAKDRLGKTVTVTKVTPSLVTTSDGERYNRFSLRPVTQPSSARELASVTDVRVLTVQGCGHLSEVAEVARNLSTIGHRRPDEVLVALEQIIMAAKVAHGAVSALMTTTAPYASEVQS